MNAAVLSPDTSSAVGVHTGFWINWSRGQILGSTITLTQRNGGLLISFIALFVTFVGTAFWTTACFAFHQYYSSNAPQDGIYHQRQAILRNASNGGSGLWALGQALWAWRSSSRRPFFRLLPLITFAILSVACFAVAGVFSSKIATATGSEVLVSSPNCGVLKLQKDTDINDVTGILWPYVNQRIISFINYAQQCYTNVTSAETCRLFVRKQLPSTVNRNASCPFSNNICRSDTGNIEVDTGYLDSNDHFGINTPPEDRFLLRRILRCAPLATEGFKNQTIIPYNGTNAPYMRYYYGETFKTADNPFGPNTSDPYTYEYPQLLTEKYKTEGDTSVAADYAITVLKAQSANGTIQPSMSAFDPMPELYQNDRDVILLFLSANQILFPNGTDDPWFSAHKDPGMTFDIQQQKKRMAKRASLDGTSAFFFADEPAAALACSSQEQVCNAHSEKSEEERCTPFRGRYDTWIQSSNASLWSSARQAALFKTFRTAVLQEENRPDEIVSRLGASALTARYSLQDGLQGPLAPDQWQREVEHWHQASLAALQGWTFEAAAGPSDARVMRWVQAPQDEGEREYCRNQKILSTSYTSFSTFGLCLTFVVGSIVIGLAHTLEPLVGWVQQRRQRPSYAYLEWCTNETLQLQRIAHEELGLGEWSRAADAIPVTKGEQRLAVLDLSDRQHPRLKAPEDGGKGEEGEGGGAAGGGGVGEEEKDRERKQALGRAETVSSEESWQAERPPGGRAVSPIRGRDGQ